MGREVSPPVVAFACDFDFNPPCPFIPAPLIDCWQLEISDGNVGNAAVDSGENDCAIKCW
jgi:hypothetical protein